MKITVCGSMQFMPQMSAVAKQLEAMGHQVFLPIDCVSEGKEKTSLSAEQKAFYIRSHFDKIALSDAILVVNEDKKGIEGYIGGNTLCEMAVAFAAKKRIYTLYPLPNNEQISYLPELRGMLPVVLNNDLSQFKVAA